VDECKPLAQVGARDDVAGGGGVGGAPGRGRHTPYRTACPVVSMHVVSDFRDEAAYVKLTWVATGECKALVPGALVMFILHTYWGNIVGALMPRRRSFRSGGGSSNANANATATASGTNPHRAQEIEEMRARQVARADAAAAAAAARAAALVVGLGR